MWKFLLPFAAFVALVVLFAFGLNPKRDIHALPSPLIGKAAPQFTLTDVLDPDAHGQQCDAQGSGLCPQRLGHLVRGLPRRAGGVARDFARQHVVPIIGLDYMDDRDKAKQWLTQLGNPYHGGGLRRRRPHGDRLGRLRRAGDVLGGRPGASHLQVHLAHDAKRSGNTNSCRASPPRASGA